MLRFWLCVCTAAAAALLALGAHGQELDEVENSVYKLEGKVIPPDQRPKDWFWKTKVVVEGGLKVGFVKEDNTFVVNGLKSGSYLVEVVNPDFFYEPVRVDINSKGKIRARKVNNVQPTQVTTVRDRLMPAPHSAAFAH